VRARRRGTTTVSLQSNVTGSWENGAVAAVAVAAALHASVAGKRSATGNGSGSVTGANLARVLCIPGIALVLPTRYQFFLTSGCNGMTNGARRCSFVGSRSIDPSIEFVCDGFY
jgi:hypothetical protein